MTAVKPPVIALIRSNLLHVSQEPFRKGKASDLCSTNKTAIYEKTDSLFIRRHGDGGMCAERDEAASGNGDL